MAITYDVNPNKLIEKVALELKKVINAPEFSKYVKTGAGRERPPADKEWYYKRAAAVLRSIYIYGPLGVNKLKVKYGSKKNRGHKPEKFYPASGKIIRTILQQLEKAELIEKEGCPEEISSLLKNKIYKLLYAWNVKLLSREILLKNGTIKYRQTATIQAQGINGEGKKFTEENKELSDNPENAILDTPEEKMKTKMTELGKKVTLKTWLLFVGIVSLSVAIGVTLYKLINRIK